MTEDYLHFIWKNKRIPKFDFQLKEHQILTIIDVGEYNEHESGPDFKFGAIQFEDIKFYGHIEMHVKSSDWYKHNHHLDRAYDNVILHVVYENDKEVIQNGFKIPVIELKEIIDDKHYGYYISKKLNKATFPCANELPNLDLFHFEYMKIKALEDKLQAKVKLIGSSEEVSLSEVLYQFMGLAFGTAINSIPFNSVLDKVPYKSLLKLNSSKRYQLVMSESGILQSSTSLLSVSQNHWNYKGTRPQNFPTVRVRQFAMLAAQFDFEINFIDNCSVELINSFRSKIEEVWTDNINGVKNLSTSFTNHLIINAIVPFIWYVGELKKDENFQSKAIDILTLIPPEKNRITRLWKQENIIIKNAFDSQSLIALHRFYCCHKKCLSCDVGKKILQK